MSATDMSGPVQVISGSPTDEELGAVMLLLNSVRATGRTTWRDRSRWASNWDAMPRPPVSGWDTWQRPRRGV